MHLNTLFINKLVVLAQNNLTQGNSSDLTLPMAADAGQKVAEADILGMMTGSGPMVQAVLFSLIILSVFSWAITIAKYLQFKKAKSQSYEFNNIFWETRNFLRFLIHNDKLFRLLITEFRLIVGRHSPLSVY